MRACCATLLLIVLGSLASLPATAEETEPVKPPRTPSLWIFGLGPVYWDAVHDLDPAGSPFADQLGRFHSWGVAIEFAYQRRAARWGGVDLLVGGDLGFFINENSEDLDVLVLPFGETIDGDLLSRGLFLTPSVRLVAGSGRRARFLFGAGAGYYEVDFAELLEGYLPRRRPPVVDQATTLAPAPGAKSPLGRFRYGRRVRAGRRGPRRSDLHLSRRVRLGPLS
jgi:hypothetical protein